MIRMRAAAAALVVGLCFNVNVGSQGGPARANPSGNGAFSFGLIGDMPYGSEGELKFPNVIDDINRDRTLAFVAHDGDIKNGSTVCSNEMFANRLELFSAIAPPVIYVPGDNEWTDCHRANNGSCDPIERLAYLRDTFFPTAESLGARTLTLERQSADPQHALFRVHAGRDLRREPQPLAAGHGRTRQSERVRVRPAYRRGEPGSALNTGSRLSVVGSR